MNRKVVFVQGDLEFNSICCFFSQRNFVFFEWKNCVMEVGVVSDVRQLAFFEAFLNLGCYSIHI